MWKGKKPLINWKDTIEPRSNEGLDLSDIEARVKVIQVIWLKKYLTSVVERPLWAFVIDQVVFKYTQKALVVNNHNKINWIL